MLLQMLGIPHRRYVSFSLLPLKCLSYVGDSNTIILKIVVKDIVYDIY